MIASSLVSKLFSYGSYEFEECPQYDERGNKKILFQVHYTRNLHDIVGEYQTQ